MHHQLRAAPDGPVRDRVEVADDDVGLHAELEQRVRSAVDTDQDGPYLLDVGPQDAEVLPVVEAPHDDEHVATAQVDRELGQVRRVSEQVPLASQVLERVLGEPLELLAHDLLGGLQLRLERPEGVHLALGHHLVAP